MLPNASAPGPAKTTTQTSTDQPLPGRSIDQGRPRVTTGRQSIQPGKPAGPLAGLPTKKPQRLTAEIVGIFRTRQPASVEKPMPEASRWRPADPAFQHFHELIDGIGKAPVGDRAKIADAVAAQLGRTGLVLPASQQSAALTVGTLLSPRWFDALGEQGLNIGDLLGALRRSDDVEPALRVELQRHLMTAFEVVVHRLARTHAGVQELRQSCSQPMRRLPDGGSFPSRPSPRLQVFSANALRLAQDSGSRQATSGQMAKALFDGLHQGRNLERREEVELVVQLAPALEALIHAHPAVRCVAKQLREAIKRIESCLKVRSMLDIADADSPAPVGDGSPRLTPRQWRGFLFEQLFAKALDPDLLNDSLRRRALGEWVHPVMVERPQSPSRIENTLTELRLTLRPLLETGLIDRAQCDALMRQLNDHLRPATAAAAT